MNSWILALAGNRVLSKIGRKFLEPFLLTERKRDLTGALSGGPVTPFKLFGWFAKNFEDNCAIVLWAPMDDGRDWCAVIAISEFSDLLFIVQPKISKATTARHLRCPHHAADPHKCLFDRQ